MTFIFQTPTTTTTFDSQDAALKALDAFAESKKLFVAHDKHSKLSTAYAIGNGGMFHGAVAAVYVHQPAAHAAIQ